METSRPKVLEISDAIMYNKYCIEINEIQKGAFVMELAKITVRGQITIPVAIRKLLGVKDGDKVIFMEENGRVIVENAAMIALKNAQRDFEGEDERLGLKDEKDVVDMVKEVRREVWEKHRERDDWHKRACIGAVVSRSDNRCHDEKNHV